MIATLLRGSLMMSALPAGIWLAMQVRKRQSVTVCTHRWSTQSSTGPWTCEWCDAAQSDCPHDTWLLPFGEGTWRCRSCGQEIGRTSADDQQ